MSFRSKELEFNLQEWSRKGHFTRENRCSRRFSASSREDRNSYRTTFTISKEIDPSNYSFTNALKTLQAKTVFNKNQDWLKPEGIELNSKWNEAEKYICNPLSGEVPMECLSSKTLISRSFRDVPNMSPPFMTLPSYHNLNNPRTTNPNVRIIQENHVSTDPVFIQAEKKVVGLKRDVGVQSAPVNVSLGKTPPVMEGSTNRQVNVDDSPVDFALKLKAQQEDVKLEEDKEHMMTKENKEEKKKGSRFLSWMKKRQRQPTKSKCLFLICLIKSF
ncbi:unnamed protein product [Eruca vesicaria subsp. sativa]|uniref:Mental retardation GTPase activating protein n=1 Tax=Eruca vesicaria subsp. sativa TaxID=29727 RepID=A0ABC8LPU9_ERUVS|nr:unnamed protein product [Eruca vesicaria subsp. sativa]